MRGNDWPALSRKEIKNRVFSALEENVNFREQGDSVLGVPASSLDPKVFYSNAPFLEDAPFLSALVSNPNHIGCHTLGNSEPFFAGTHRIEAELIDLCATKILKSDEPCDGYIAAGGTEANIQAVWMHRNFFIEEFEAQTDEIALICSEDSHYSVFKAANILNIHVEVVRVNPDTRQLDAADLDAKLRLLKSNDFFYAIAFCNMMTTMFGSVDDPAVYASALERHEFMFKLHVDGAYGGFFHPFCGASNVPDLSLPEVASVTLDAHKMVQAPYGTGVFVARKELMKYTCTSEASYVSGADFTLSGSRSGANAIAVWMILMTYGRTGWEEKIRTLVKRADFLANQLDELDIMYYRSESSNIVTIRAQHVPIKLAERFGLVPDNHDSPNWFKVVVMEHVSEQALQQLVDALRETSTVD